MARVTACFNIKNLWVARICRASMALWKALVKALALDICSEPIVKKVLLPFPAAAD